MYSIRERLAQQGSAILADGAMGTMLQGRGLPVGSMADVWSVERPDAVAAVHREYAAAGCEVVLTNTINANGAKFSADSVVDLNSRAVSLARESGARWVAGSLGPEGDGAQARVLAEAGADLLWLETQLSLTDTLRLVEQCRSVTMLPIVVTFSFHREEGLTQAGDHAAKVAESLEAGGVDAVGLNCGNGFEGVGARLAEMAEGCTLPLVLKPNAGVPVRDGEQWRYTLSADEWSTQVASLITSRVRIVGGCCGTTPAHLNELHSVL